MNRDWIFATWWNSFRTGAKSEPSTPDRQSDSGNWPQHLSRSGQVDHSRRTEGVLARQKLEQLQKPSEMRETTYNCFDDFLKKIAKLNHKKHKNKLEIVKTENFSLVWFTNPKKLHWTVVIVFVLYLFVFWLEDFGQDVVRHGDDGDPVRRTVLHRQAVFAVGSDDELEQVKQLYGTVKDLRSNKPFYAKVSWLLKIHGVGSWGFW